MILIIGGKYQGKHDYAIEHFGDSKIIDFDGLRKSGWGMQGFTGKYCFGSDFGSDQGNIVIIAEENASGVVPAEPGLIREREEYNRSLTLLAEKADEIYRVFCGIGMKIK